MFAPFSKWIWVDAESISSTWPSGQLLNCVNILTNSFLDIIGIISFSASWQGNLAVQKKLALIFNFIFQIQHWMTAKTVPQKVFKVSNKGSLVIF